MNDLLAFAFGTVVLLGAFYLAIVKASAGEFTGLFVRLLAGSITSIAFMVLFKFVS